MLRVDDPETEGEEGASGGVHGGVYGDGVGDGVDDGVDDGAIIGRGIDMGRMPHRLLYSSNFFKMSWRR